MKGAVCCIALFLVCLTSVHGVSCPYKWFFDPVNNRCYYFENSETLASYQADERCRRYGGHLVTLNDMTELNLCVTNFPSTADVYIGLNDKEIENTYRWFENDAPLDWEGNFPQPHRSNGRNDCVIMNAGSGGTGLWTEVQCNAKYNYICEVAAS